MRSHGVFFLGLALATAGPLSAQGLPPTPGIQIGYSRADLGGAEAARGGNREGTLAGVFVRADLTRVLTVQPELLFARKGGRFTVTIDDPSDPAPPTTGVANLELIYIETPVLLRIHLPRPRGAISPVAFAGPAAAFRIGCEVTVAPTPPGGTPDCQQNNIFNLRSVDFGVVVGGGIQVRYSTSTVALEARFTSGLAGIGRENGSVKNRALAVLLSVTL